MNNPYIDPTIMYPQPKQGLNVIVKIFIILIIIAVFSIIGYFIYINFNQPATSKTATNTPISNPITSTPKTNTPTSNPTNNTTSNTTSNTITSNTTTSTTINKSSAGIEAVTNFVTGQPVQCSTADPKGYPNNAVYRYTGNNTINWYSSNEIALSWDPNWKQYKTIDCTSLTLGPDMKINTNLGPTLLPGKSIPQNSQLTSNNGKYKLLMQGDGNLVLYQTIPSDKVVWATNTISNNTPFMCLFQVDGNLVIYDGKSNVVWASNTAGKMVTVLSLQDDGNLVIYNNSTAIWATNTVS